MSLLIKDGNPDAVLQGPDFTSQGETKTLGDDLALVCGCAQRSESWISSKQWVLRWQESDLLFQSPQPFETYENSYVLASNVRRFTVAKTCNSIVPQLYKGLFYENPPMILRPRPGTSQKTTDEKTAVMSYLLDSCQFKREVKWGMEELVLQGTGIWKWGIEPHTKRIPRRIAQEIKTSDTAGGAEKISSDGPPKIEWVEKLCWKPIFEWRPLNRVLVAPDTQVGDIRESLFAIDVRYMNFYQLQDLKNNNSTGGKADAGWTWDEYYSDEKLKELWNPPMESTMTPGPLRTDSRIQNTGVTHHAEPEITTDTITSDPLARNLEVLEYWDKRRKVIVLNRKKVIFTDKNPFDKIPFLSANWWNIPKAFYGLGVGTTVGQNQRVDQGVINSILKILSFGVNPVYLRSRDSNSPTQMIRTTLGKMVTVDGDVDKAYKLLEMPKVPGETWAALQNSEAATESTSGADSALVGGSAKGPTSGIGRSATGAGALAAASAGRLDGPLDNFINQVFIPFLNILDELAYTYLSDQEIKDILGDKMGEEYMAGFDTDVSEEGSPKPRAGMQAYHDAQIEFETLAGASLASKRVMQQSMTLISQYLGNPQFLEYLADLGLYVDQETILHMWLMASEWKDYQDIIKPMPPEMQAKRMQKMQMQQQGPLQTQMALQEQKGAQKAQLEQQRSQNRLQGDLTRYAIEASAKTEETEGEPGNIGFGSLEV